MVSRAEQKIQTHQRMVDAAGRSFRKGGFGGIGVDGLAREAGVTSGAFYVHFSSKTEAFRAAVARGMEELKEGVLYFQSAHGKKWWAEFVRFYLGSKRTCDLSQSCTLQSLSPELGRSDLGSREVFEAGMKAVAETIIRGPVSAKAPSDIDSACVALSMLIGAVTLGRAVGSEAFSEQIAGAAGRALLGANWTEGDRPKSPGKGEARG